MISWQKLVFDKDCCAQAFRLLLTRIKSSRRIAASSASSSQRSLSAGATQQPQREESEELTGDSVHPEDDRASSDVPSHFPRQRLGFKSKLRTTVRKSTMPEGDGVDGWNYDISVSGSEWERSNNNAETPRESRTRGFELPMLAVPGSNVVIERQASNTKQQVLNQAAKERKSQLQVLQRENAVLMDENARLKEEVAHLEAVNAVLQNDISGAEPANTFDLRRMRLVQAQNLQLQRQVSLLQSSVADMQQTESSLLAALNRWRSVVDAGVQEAKAAGADQAGQSESGKDLRWMMAVPDALVSELKRIETQISNASSAISTALESKLRVSGASSSYLRSPATTLKTADVYADGHHPPTSHLRLDRVKLLESKLVRLGRLADAFTEDVLQTRPPRVRIDSALREERHDVSALADATRHVLLELGALGAVVSNSTTPEEADSESQLTTMHVLKVFAAASNGKDREKALKMMLKQLHARHVAMENEMNACRRETRHWRVAWQMQAEIVTLLANRVSTLGDKKMQWFHAALADPLRRIVQAFDGFQRAQIEGTSRQNPHLPVLIETLESQQSVLVECLSQWRSHSGAVETQLKALFDDYEANALVLESSNQ